MTTIKEGMDSLNIELNERHINKMGRIVVGWEQRFTEALHTPMLGIDKAIFTQRDQDYLFELFDIYKPDLKKAIIRMDSINPKFKVISNSFNNACVYILHRSFELNESDRKRMQLYIFKYLNYKFFTSITNNFFKYPPSKEKLTYVINNLSGRYLIKRYGTWYGYINHISKMFVDGKNIHYRGIKSYTDDEAIIYAISNIQGKVKSSIKNISNEFYDLKEGTVGIKTFNSVLDGPENKYLNENINKTYIRINNVKTEIINENLFINRKLIDSMIKRDFKNLNKYHRILYKILSHISQESLEQSRNNKFNEPFVKDDKNEFIAIGTLINDILVFTNGLIQLKKIKANSVVGYIYLFKEVCYFA